MKDGSGDFTVIQHAVAAAAAGDIVQIGPGRFEDVHAFQLPGGIQEAHCRATQTELTIVGAGIDVTIIGPATGPGTEQDPIGIMASPTTRLYVRALTVENTDDGVQANGPYVSLEGCLFRGCDQGLDTLAWEGTWVRQCTFVDAQGTGIVVFQGLGATNVLIEDCEFLGGPAGVDLQSQGGMVRNCRFSGQIGTGLQLSFGAQATIEGCTFEDMLSYGVVLTGGASGTLTGNHVGPTQVGLLVNSDSQLIASGNVFEGGTVATVWFTASTSVAFHDNHVFNTGGWSAYFGAAPAPKSFDVRYNWWGTTDAAQIDAWTRDWKDGATNTTVLFEPFHGMPIATRSRSFGQLKASFDAGRP